MCAAKLMMLTVLRIVYPLSNFAKRLVGQWIILKIPIIKDSRRCPQRRLWKP